MPKQITRPSYGGKNVIPGGKLNNFLNSYSDKLANFKTSKNFYIGVLILGILLLAIYKKSWFIAATVNGMPITNPELQMQLNNQFRTQTLDQLITKKIILDEATKNNALPTEKEIDEKVKELETQVGGTETLDSLLSQQGQTRTSWRNDTLKLQLAITKLYEKEATVSAIEIAKYIEDNKEVMQATDSASQEKEAEEALKQQKLSQIFNEKFQDLRSKAKIQIF